MKKESRGIPENIKQTTVAAIPLLVVIILFVLVGNFGVSKVKNIQAEVKTAEISEKTLTQKLDILKTLSEEVPKTALVNSAVPGSNPSLAVIGQLKNVAIINTVILSSIKANSGSTDPSGLNIVSISFNAMGARSQIFSFLNDLSKIAPITTITSVKMSELAGATDADISVKTYWAELPKTIPSVTTPISDLTTDEKRILSEVSGLTQPNFTQLTPSQTDINSNPFGQ